MCQLWLRIHFNLHYPSFFDLKVLKEDIDDHREPFKQMKYLSYKITDVCMEEDRVYIQVAVVTLEKRWKEAITTSNARRKSLEENYKLSQKFFSGIEDLMKMLDDAEKSLKEEEPIGADPSHLRLQLKQHKVCLGFIPLCPRPHH